MDKIFSEYPFSGLMINLDERTGDFITPPDEFTGSEPTTVKDPDDNDALACNKTGCGGKVKLEEKGNKDHAWYFLTNSSSGHAIVSIDRFWKYEGSTRKDSRTRRVKPGERLNVYNMDRRQSPKCCITKCVLEED